MFPMTVTVHNRAQLDVVLQAISQTNEYAKEKAIHAEPDAKADKQLKAAHMTAEQAAKKPARNSAPAATESSNTTSEAETSADTAASPSSEDLFKELKDAILALAAKKNRDAAVAVLKEFGAARVTELDAAKYPEVLAAAKAALAGEA